MCRGIADLTPMFPIGQRTAYHSLNFGYINGEILRRVDGRSIAQFLQEEICKPLGIDGAYLGVPDSELHARRGADGRAACAGRIRRAHGRRARGLARRGGFQQARGRQAAIPGSGGIFSARGLARHYAMLRELGASSTACACCPRRAFAPASSCRASSGTRSTNPRAPRARLPARPRHRARWPRPRRSATSAGAAPSATRILRGGSGIGFAKNYFA